MRAALGAAVREGTAHGCDIPGLSVHGKTGTAENPHGNDHAWFVCYAPADNPTIAIAVIVENGGHGGTAAVPVARRMLETYFDMHSTSAPVVRAVAVPA